MLCRKHGGFMFKYTFAGNRVSIVIPVFNGGLGIIK